MCSIITNLYASVLWGMKTKQKYNLTSPVSCRLHSTLTLARFLSSGKYLNSTLILARFLSTGHCLHSTLIFSSFLVIDDSWLSPFIITLSEEFKVLWTETLTSLSINRFVRSRFWAWALLPHSTKKEPSLSLLMFFRVPAMAWKPFWTAKRDNLLLSKRG